MSRNRTILAVTGVVVLTGLFCAGAWFAVAGRSDDTASGTSVAELSGSVAHGTGRISMDAAGDATTTSTTAATVASPPSSSAPAGGSSAPATAAPSSSAPAPAGSSGSSGSAGSAGSPPVIPLGPLPFDYGIFTTDLTAPTIGSPSLICAVGSDIVGVTVTDAAGVGSVWLTWQESGVDHSADLTHPGGTSWTISITPSSSGWFAFGSLHNAVLHAKDINSNTSTRLVGTIC